MARATSGLGQFRGKVGSVVFRVNQGQQIASAYQPAVRNPKSNLQTAQRNKMYLASQIGKLIPREDIIGLEPRGTARDRRSILMRNIIDSSVSALNGEVFNTSLDAVKLKLSYGRNLFGSIIGQIDTNDDEPSTITLNINMEEEMYNRLAIRLVQIDVINDMYSSYKSSWLELPTYNASGVTVSLSFTTLSAMGTIFYAIPVLLADGVRYSREKKTLVQVAQGGEIAIQGVYAVNSAVYEWCESIYIGSSRGGEIVPPSTGGDEVVNPDGPNFPNLG